MRYKIYRFEFNAAVHFGKRSLDSFNVSFGADTLFSALCTEAVRQGNDRLTELVEMAKQGELSISNGLPYLGERYYVPKPMLRIETQDQGNSSLKKAFKRLLYIPTDKLKVYLEGRYDPRLEKDCLSELGESCMKVSAAIRGLKETLPYRVGEYRFAEGNGLYCIIGCEKEQQREFVEELLESLSYEGIGGKRSAGLGSFHLKEGKMDQRLENRLRGDKADGVVMTLSDALPREDELESALENASYNLIRKSGFVASADYPNRGEGYKRKRDLYVFQAGSCFKNRFQGDVFDVSAPGQGRHSVYRYGKPLFLEVDE